MRAVNERVIFQLIKNQQATSQVQLAQRLNLPSNTVHGIVNRLLKMGVITEDHSEKHGRGRPIQHYRIFRKARVLVIQWLGSVWHAGVFSDNQLVGAIQNRNSPLLKNCQEAMQMLREFRDLTLEQAGVDRSTLDETVLSINAERVVNNPALISSVIPWVRELSEEDLEKKLGGKINLEIQYSSASSELRARAGENVHSLVLFNVGDGVSSHGVSLDQIWASQHIIYGELGHVVVDPNGPICGCGHRGCLEALISGPSLLRRLETDVQNGVQTRLADCIGKAPAELFNRLEILERKGGDSYANTIVQELINRSAWAISVIVNLLRPDVIVLSGYALVGRDEWRQRILTAAQSLIRNGETEAIRLEFPKVGVEDHLRNLAFSFTSREEERLS